jgi:hypothetical protein
MLEADFDAYGDKITRRVKLHRTPSPLTPSACIAICVKLVWGSGCDKVQN